MSVALRDRIWYIWCKVATAFLAFTWTAGLLLGMICAMRYDGVGELFFRAVRSPVWPATSLYAAILPFAISGLAVSLSEPWLLLVISGTKAFCFGFCACGTILAFGQSSWLVRFLFLFSDLCLIPVLIIYWLRHLNGQSGNRWELRGCIMAAIVVAYIDCFVVSPFLVSLFR